MGDPAKPNKVGISIDFIFFKLETEWVEDPRQRNAAWALYVELVTRVTTQEIGLDSGILREAFNSLHAMFGITRQILRQEGPIVGASRKTVGGMAIQVLNRGIRPFLAKWHPQLLAWEAARTGTTSAREHERAWKEEPRCRGELVALQRALAEYAQKLAVIAGADDPLA